jgi:hypothetical protein
MGDDDDRWGCDNYRAGMRAMGERLARDYDWLHERYGAIAKDPTRTMGGRLRADDFATRSRLTADYLRALVAEVPE